MKTLYHVSYDGNYRGVFETLEEAQAEWEGNLTFIYEMQVEVDEQGAITEIIKFSEMPFLDFVETICGEDNIEEEAKWTFNYYTKEYNEWIRVKQSYNISKEG